MHRESGGDASGLNDDDCNAAAWDRHGIRRHGAGSSDVDQLVHILRKKSVCLGLVDVVDEIGYVGVLSAGVTTGSYLDDRALRGHGCREGRDSQISEHIYNN